jgi:hypothetical protein
VEDWLRKDPALKVVAERPFRSVLAVSVPWSTYEAGRARRFSALIEEALRIAAADRPHYDAAVAAMSGWSVDVVRAVADRNTILGGRGGALAWSDTDTQGLERAATFAAHGQVRANDLLGLELLEGRWPAPRIVPGKGGPGKGGPGKGPPGMGPPNGGAPGKGPPGMGPPGKGPPGMGPPEGGAPGMGPPKGGATDGQKPGAGPHLGN